VVVLSVAMPQQSGQKNVMMGIQSMVMDVVVLVLQKPLLLMKDVEMLFVTIQQLSVN
jgi:hypothetical protein